MSNFLGALHIYAPALCPVYFRWAPTPFKNCSKSAWYIRLLLENEGYLVFPAADFDCITEQAAKKSLGLILLDINLPGQDGFSLCAALRKAVSAPIIFVTSRDSGADEVQALSLSGDDYITKPYSVPVLLARIKAVLRRSGGVSEPADVVETAGLRLSLTKGTLTSGEKAVELTRNEIQIMVCLMEHSGEIVSRADLIDALWDNQIYIDDNTLRETGSNLAQLPYQQGVGATDLYGYGRLRLQASYISNWHWLISAHVTKIQYNSSILSSAGIVWQSMNQR